MSDRLIVLLDGRRCGILKRLRGGAAQFTYEDDWESFPISLSMPIAGGQFSGDMVANYFWGLISDNTDIVKGWAQSAQTSPNDLFGLLAEVGEDCAGAVQVLTAEKLKNIERRKTEGIKWVSNNEIAERLRELHRDQSAWRRPEDLGRLSLAGALPKTAFLKDGDSWGVPSGMIPTTHIFKPEMQDLNGQLIDEHICLRLAQSLDMHAANSEIMQFEDQRAIVVERYDRFTTNDGKIIRLHQEDMCQALGMHPNLKYQNDGGPSIGQITELLRNVSESPNKDVETFIKAQLYNWLIGGTDAHAKNYSLLILPNGKIALAPLYDINSTLPFYAREIRKLKLAMKIGKNYQLSRITGRDWARMAKECRVNFSKIAYWKDELISKIPSNFQTIAKEVKSQRMHHPIVNQMELLLETHLTTCDKQFADQ